MPGAFVFCPYCGEPLERRLAFDQVRPVCPACGFIHFYDPKVAVIGLVSWDAHVLLIRRGVEPELGKWALPGGYMDAGEMPEEAVRREVLEEVGIEIVVTELVDVFPMRAPDQRTRGIVLAYAAHPAGKELVTLQSLDDVREARWLRAHELPADLAFESTVALLERWRQEIENNEAGR